MGRVAIIGDVGGHLAQLTGCLARLGVVDGVWPAGLHVIQVGDMFGGRDDVEVARLVQPHLYAGRWTQLIGNWELEAVGGPSIHTPKEATANPEALGMFARWHGAGLVRYATAVNAATGTTALVTHAGLTGTWWDANTGSEPDVHRVVTSINNAEPGVLHFGGEMFVHRPRLAPSPVWASTSELWTSWADRRLPWPQIHGHSVVYDWQRRSWLEWAPRALIRHATPRPDRRHVRFDPPNGVHPIFGIDPGLGDRPPANVLHPLVVTVNDTDH